MRKRVEFDRSVKMRMFGCRSRAYLSLKVILASLDLLISHIKLFSCFFFLLLKRILDVVDIINEVNILHDFFVIKGNDL